MFQFFLSSTCFEHLMFIIRKTILYMEFIMVYFSCVYVSRLSGGRRRLILFVIPDSCISFVQFFFLCVLIFVY